MMNQRQQLDDQGYTVLPDVLDRRQLAALQTHVESLFAAEGDRAGAEFKQERGSRRLANLVAKGELVWDLLTHSRVLQLVQQVLSDRVKLSSLNVRSVNANWRQAQPLHCDMGALPDESGFWVCNVVWLLDDFTPDNGPLRVIPRSHRWNCLPQELLNDPTDDHPDQVVITASAGSVIVLNAHLWHGGMANLTTTARTAIHAFYCRRDKPQQQYQKQLLPEKVQQQLPRDLRDLLAIDDPENDRLAGIETQRSGFLQ